MISVHEGSIIFFRLLISRVYAYVFSPIPIWILRVCTSYYYTIIVDFLSFLIFCSKFYTCGTVARNRKRLEYYMYDVTTLLCTILRSLILPLHIFLPLRRKDFRY
jgi:hypothetical protein